MRAVPGSYSVRLSVDDRTETQPVTVRMDPRITVSDTDMRAWHEQASLVERMECRADAAAAEVRDLDARFAKRIADGQSPREAEDFRKRLRPLVLAFVGDARDPGHVNLPTDQLAHDPGRQLQRQADARAGPVDRHLQRGCRSLHPAARRLQAVGEDRMTRH